MSTTTTINWHERAESVLAGTPITREEARQMLNLEDSEVLDLVHAAWTIRKHYFGNKVRLHILENAKSGQCPEDCSFCSQSAHHNSEIPTYRMLSPEEMVEGAREAKAAGAARYCIVTATRGPSEDDLDHVCTAVKAIKEEVDIDICTSLGILTEEKAKRLVEAGVDRFNHNLETGPEHFKNVVTTHTFEDRVNTIRIAHDAGMETCCGGIMGMGETRDDLVDLAFSLRELGVNSIPLNFLDARPGTPLEGVDRLSPLECLRALAMFRFVVEGQELRVAGGREVNLRHLQPMALWVANSMFTNGYLTTGGQDENEDIRMIRDAGFEIETLGCSE
jgi:biotin synthase